MIVFPNCKINLGLNIIRKRGDGYHDLETVFYPLALQDALEVVDLDDSKRTDGDNPCGKFSTSGEMIECKPEDNLCVKACSLLKSRYPSIRQVSMHLHKSIPPGSGLGGGSSDGAFTLQLLNQKFSLGLTTEQLLDHALQLGSDCPFFIINKPCFATGRGEFLDRIDVNLSAYRIVVVTPRIHIQTSKAFSSIRPAFPSKSIKEIIKQPIQTWRDDLKNDFEETIFKNDPEIKHVKDELYRAGALYSSMSGSGSSVYGIFKKDTVIDLAFPKTYFIKELISKSQQLP
ncbi:MAG TPA: 4-(cytidine 5'-diphospho)-2-C-methyl-D-erythritol kinase [Chitinophagaceae bacterium]|nr:4-(cytidine 5'-diphospho)-2-C-methyl-D-erythritol kinase [Chitinophagaceae bacterium]